MKPYQDSRKRNLEGQRKEILSEENFEILLTEKSTAERAANAIPNMDRQLRSQHVEIYHRDQNYEASRREETLLHAELQGREKAHRDARIKNTQGVEELKEICCSEAEGPQELRADAFFRHDLRECQSSINQLTVQILFDEYECESVSCALCYFEWAMAEEWSQLQFACPCIQITLKIKYVYLIEFKTVNSVHI